MKTSLKFSLLILALIVVSLALLWQSNRQANATTPVTDQPVPTAYRQAAAPMQKPAAPATAARSNPPSTDLTMDPPALMFGELSRLGELVRKTTRQFTATLWEPELRRALDLPASVPRQRRTGIFRMTSGFLAPLIRIDRVYRTDRSARASASATSFSISQSSSSSIPTNIACG
jgi:hypothetical protein